MACKGSLVQVQLSPPYTAHNTVPRGTVFCYGGSMIVCIDEAGMGPWAGPLSVAAVIPSHALQERFDGGYIADSKVVPKTQRAVRAQYVCQHAQWFGVRLVSNAYIDQYGLAQARADAIQSLLDHLPRAVLKKSPSVEIRIDGVGSRMFHVEHVSIDPLYVVRGDQQEAGIASASLLAKVSRDAAMQQYDRIYPQYGFAQHKGYGTAVHRERLRTYGVSPLHRASYAPIQALLKTSAGATTVENVFV